MVFFVAVHGLEIGRGSLKSRFKQRFQRGDAAGVVRHAFRARHKNIRNGFIAVNIQKHIHARFVHFLAHKKHFGAARHAGVLPFAVQVRARCVGAQIA